MARQGDPMTEQSRTMATQSQSGRGGEGANHDVAIYLEHCASDPPMAGASYASGVCAHAVCAAIMRRCTHRHSEL